MELCQSRLTFGSKRVSLLSQHGRRSRVKQIKYEKEKTFPTKLLQSHVSNT